MLKRKKRTDTQYDNTARFDGQIFGKLKVATWKVKGTAGKTEELQTELLKRKIEIAPYQTISQIVRYKSE